jgi:hypothetical protein
MPESPVESSEYQHDTDIHDQPFPESVFEKHEIDADDDGYHRQAEKQNGYLSSHVGIYPIRIRRIRVDADDDVFSAEADEELGALARVAKG